ncbi:N-acyl homoserine lactonase AttM [Penicillium cataractarum]|uniref:N-acyl homoserine lactonase AttM n=1 Tax=Penicillium cataractarum TaxID=2100454 RepID=A0A9W9RNT0_9EURO|nr:N-acyl homoserine lactonase AttM [Penicillium cataractarum]KAJ5363635.1 N-acyl homoserine lactonase AttM [Penicillium cataractarum]
MELPLSRSTVTVRIIDTTSRIIVPNDFTESTIKGAEFLDCPAFSFLIEHPSGRRLLFDLGLRPDYQNLPPIIQKYFSENDAKVSVEKGVSQLLAEDGVDPSSIEGIIWSHWHYDHVGDPSTFPSNTALIVGPGFRETFVPGYPSNPGSPILESDYTGRELKEVDFANDENRTTVGNFNAIDYFGDRSFYILDAPGHTIGHLCALARTTADPESFILMGADACHHSAEMRPSRWLPLPSKISPHPLEPDSPGPCPGSIFEHMLRNGDSKIPIYGQKRPGMIFSNPDIAEETIEKLQEADAKGNIFVVIAHDSHLKGTVDFFPKYANDFLRQGWDVKTKWKFLSDFKQALLGEETHSP